jgi:signal transduction histidine kinase
VRARRALGLQGWLVAALLAVGLAASLAVLLVVLPTLESSVRTDRAKREAQQLRDDLRRVGAGGLPFPATQQQAQDLADRVSESLGAEVLVEYRSIGDVFGSGAVSASAPEGGLEYIGRVVRVPTGPTVIGDGEAVAASAALEVAGAPPGSITAAERLAGVAPELAIVRRRVIIAMIVVLGLAALAGIALARVLGGRMRRLASTAADLAAGDLSARAPEAGRAPEEVQVLRRSINGMAERLQSLVGAITSERDRDRAMIGSLAEGVLAVGPDGTVTVANDAAGRMLGLPDDAESARLDAMPAPIIDAVLAARGDGPPPRPRQVTLGDGLELELAVARLGEGPHAGTVITLRDVTAQRRLERARRDLVANVSHELKTPIAALKGFLELLEDERVSERDRREFLAAMSQETARLERLVEEQLQLARLDAGALPLAREALDLGALAEEVVAPRIPLAAREGIELSARPDASAAAVVHADPARIEQILLILLDNALRHTPAGGRVEVAVGRDGGHATVAVRDTGEGIAAGSQPFVFDRFYRGDASREGRSAGLGLAIARGLAAAHGGAIDLESEVGRGSTFTLRLPLREGGPPAPGPAPAGLSRAAPG